jgi:hypothetical protein
MADFNLANVTALPFRSNGVIAINRFVKQDTSLDRCVVQAAAGTDKIFGVATEAGTASNFIGVQCFGIAKVEAGAAVAKGAMVTSDGSGRGILAVTSDNPQGIALTAAGAAGDIFEVLLHGGPNVTGPTTP